MQHQFSQVPKANIPRSSFDRSHGLKTTFDAGKLIPIYVDEALPGDTFKMRATLFGRLATPIAPIMDNLFLDTHYFAVPLRLLWENWEKFNGAQDNPDDSTDYVVPTMAAPATTGYDEGTLSDYLTIPTKVPDLEHASFWHRAYNLIYNEWYRDQNLQDSVVVDTDDGPDDPTDYTLLNRGKRHDYFTSCLPWPQKGPAVDIPLGEQAPVSGIGMQTQVFGTGAQSAYETDGTGASTYQDWKNTGLISGDNYIYVEEDPNNAGFPNIRVDLTEATAATINSLRQAFQIQKLYERDARGGTRYIEIILSHFGVSSPDSRLQRPEYLGGSSNRININPVTQTSETATTPQGNLSAFGTVLDRSGKFTHSFTEHCIVIGLASVRADLTYQQGLDKKFSRSSRFDFYWPALAHLGEQAVLNQEIYAQDPATDTGSTGTPDNEKVFGYQERFAEYRYFPSKITGLFRSNATASLDSWHLSQDFSTLPALNDSFMQENPPIDRVIAVPDEPHLILDCYFNLKCARPMPTYSVPGLIDHL